MTRCLIFIYRCIRLRSIALARWVQAYDDYTPKY